MHRRAPLTSLTYSGTSDTCVTNNIDDAWEPLSQWLRCNGRQALNTETGGGNTASCEEYICEQVDYQAENSDGKLLRTTTASADVLTHLTIQ